MAVMAKVQGDGSVMILREGGGVLVITRSEADAVRATSSANADAAAHLREHARLGMAGPPADEYPAAPYAVSARYAGSLNGTGN